MAFGFREPYQVLSTSVTDENTAGAILSNVTGRGQQANIPYGPVDSQMIQDTARFKMDLLVGLERVLHGKIKPSELLSLRGPNLHI